MTSKSCYKYPLSKVVHLLGDDFYIVGHSVAKDESLKYTLSTMPYDKYLVFKNIQEVDETKYAFGCFTEPAIDYLIKKGQDEI